MPKKFMFFVIMLLFLAGCGASESAADALPEAINIIKTSPEEAECTTFPVEEPKHEIHTFSQGKEDMDACVEKTAGESDYQYFTFRRTSRSQENDDGISILAENRCDMSFFSRNPAIQEWIDGVLLENQQNFDTNSSNLVRYAEDVIAEYGSDSFYTYSNYQDQGIIRHDSRVVSLLAVSHVHSGGAHPNTVQTAINFDMEEQKLLKLEDVIYEDDVAELERMVQNTVKNKFEMLDIDALYEDYPDTISRSMSYGEMTPYWYFGYNALVIFYNQYELGPYAAGIIKVEVPYEKLHGILREEFFPEVSECRCDLAAVADAQDREQIPCIIEPNGQQILISTNGTVRGVQVSEVFWVDDTPVSQAMMISINEMNEQNVLVLTGGFDDETRSFAVEFSDGSGKRQMYYIHPEGLSEEP